MLYCPYHKKLNPFFLKPKTDYCIIECFHSGVRTLILQLKDNELTFKRFYEYPKEVDLEGLFHLLKLRKDSNVLFVYDQSVAATFAGFVKLEKNNLRAPISEDDLQTFLGAATRQFFNRFREEAKRRLAVDEVNVILANNRFLNLYLDGKEVISPLGQTARFAELEMEQTFLSRNFWDTLPEELQEIKNVFHIELTGALRDSLALLYPDRKVLLVVVSPNSTEVFSCGNKNRYFGAVSFPRMQKRGDFAWGNNDLMEVVKTYFKLGDETAKTMFTLYVTQAMSKHLERAFQKLIEPFHIRFETEIAKFLRKEEICVVLSNPLFLTAGSTLAHKEAVHITFDDLVRGLNYEIKAPIFMSREAFSPVFLSGLIAYLHRTSDNYLSVLAKEKLKWLVPANSA